MALTQFYIPYINNWTGSDYVLAIFNQLNLGEIDAIEITQKHTHKTAIIKFKCWTNALKEIEKGIYYNNQLKIHHSSTEYWWLKNHIYQYSNKVPKSMFVCNIPAVINLNESDSESESEYEDDDENN